MRFYEQICDGRTVLSDQIERNAQRVMDDVDAPCWLEAKRMLGYGLSAVQACLLDSFYAERERAA